MRILRSVRIVAVMAGFAGAALAADPGTNLSVSNAPTPSVADPDTDVTFDIVVSCSGPDPADNATLDDQLAGMTFVSVTQVSGPAFSCTAPAVGATGSVDCTLASMDAGAAAEFSIVAHVPPDASAGSFITTMATVSTSTFDQSSEDDSAAGVVQVTPPPSADLRLTETSAPGANADTDVSFTIELDNGGPGDATNVVLQSAFIDDLAFVSLTQTSGPTFACSSTIGGSSCTIATLASGASAVFLQIKHVPAGEGDGTRYTEIWTVTSDFDPSDENNEGVTGVCIQANGCAAGPCNSSQAVICAIAGVCENQGTCDPNTSLCSANTPNTGNVCDDGNSCTQTDTCVAGVCTGTNPVVCPTAFQCQLQGVCDPSTGRCGDNLPVDDGAPCDDENACTEGDSCKSGDCVGASAVVCPAAGPCATQGICNPANGTCTPNVPLAGRDRLRRRRRLHLGRELPEWSLRAGVDGGLSARRPVRGAGHLRRVERAVRRQCARRRRGRLRRRQRLHADRQLHGRRLRRRQPGGLPGGRSVRDARDVRSGDRRLLAEHADRRLRGRGCGLARRADRRRAGCAGADGGGRAAGGGCARRRRRGLGRCARGRRRRRRRRRGRAERRRRGHDGDDVVVERVRLPHHRGAVRLGGPAPPRRPVRRLAGAPPQTLSGSRRIRFPVNVKSAFATAGATAGTAVSPMPPACSVLRTMVVSTFGAPRMSTSG